MNFAVVILGYLLGSFPTAYVAGRIKTGRDIRCMGDSNMGAANAFRILGHKIGIVVYVIDVGKGALAVLIAEWFHLPQVFVFAAGIAVVLGHNWPVFLGFRGGRGESTTIGVLYVITPVQALIMTLPTILVLRLTRNVIAASAFLFVLMPILCWQMHSVAGTVIVYEIALSCLVGFTHFLRTRKQAVVN
jgi:acyl phosphate:glycerol-3-phosphate acyltransferase